MSLVKRNSGKKTEQEERQEEGNRQRAKVKKLLKECGLPGADDVLKSFLSSLRRKFGFSNSPVVTFHVLETHQKSILDLCEACLVSGDLRKARVALFKNQKTEKFYVIGEIFLGRFGWRHLRRRDETLIHFESLKSLKRFLTHGANDLSKEFYEGKAQASPNNTKKIRNKIVLANN